MLLSRFDSVAAMCYPILGDPRMSWSTVFTAALLCFATAAYAEVADMNSSGFLIKHEVTVNATPAKAYKTLVDEIGGWWNPAHTYSNDAGNLSIDARPGGCFCEKLPNGGGVQHMSVVYASPGQVVRMMGALGPLQSSGRAGSMTWKFTPGASVTRIELSYSVGGYLQGGFEKIAPAVDGVVGEQLGRLKTFIETGKPTLAK
jgi:uncharacterized protein YndB with AHSA1/START domain